MLNIVTGMQQGPNDHELYRRLAAFLRSYRRGGRRWISYGASSAVDGRTPSVASQTAISVGTQSLYHNTTPMISGKYVPCG